MVLIFAHDVSHRVKIQIHIGKSGRIHKRVAIIFSTAAIVFRSISLQEGGEIKNEERVANESIERQTASNNIYRGILPKLIIRNHKKTILS